MKYGNGTRCRDAHPGPRDSLDKVNEAGGRMLVAQYMLPRSHIYGVGVGAKWRRFRANMTVHWEKGQVFDK